jgi:hypothetical protein
MQYYRCKCGSSESHTSMGVPRCESCPKCGSDLAQHPDDHREPAAHRWAPDFDSHTGERKPDVCLACHGKRTDGGQTEPVPGAPA